MTKCPECGKELSINEILIPVHDAETHALIGFFHSDKALFDTYIESCLKNGTDPAELFMEFIEEYMAWSKKKHAT